MLFRSPAMFTKPFTTGSHTARVEIFSAADRSIVRRAYTEFEVQQTNVCIDGGYFWIDGTGNRQNTLTISGSCQGLNSGIPDDDCCPTGYECLGMVSFCTLY